MEEQEELPQAEEVAVVEIEPASTSIQPSGISPFDLEPVVFQAALDRRKANREALLKWLASSLKDDVDFGRIHVVSKEKCPKGKYCTDPRHFSKDTLFKPGAEKICSMLGLTARYPNAAEYEEKAIRGEPIDTIILRCELVSASGLVCSEGMGARKVEYGDLNKALKMAEKSAKINATLQLGLSDIYTQDIEDMVADGRIAGTPVSEETQAHLDSAKANREAAARDYLPEATEATETAPEAPGEAQDRSRWGDIGPHEIVVGQVCDCGSFVIRRTTRDQRIHVTCELSYRGFKKQGAALEMLVALDKKHAEKYARKEVQADKIKHYYKMEDAP